MMTPQEAPSTLMAERAHPYPSNPEPETDTSETNIVRSNNEVEFEEPSYEYDTSVIPRDLDTDVLRESIETSLAGVITDIKHRVKVELVTQIYRDAKGDVLKGHGVDYASLVEKVRNEYISQSRSNAFMASRLTISTMPAAERRIERDLYNHKNYSVVDLGNLGIRAETHHFIDQYAQAMAHQSDDKLQATIEEYVTEQLPAARSEVLQIVLEQKAALQREAVEAGQRILQLERTIEELQGEVVDRDIEMWDTQIGNDHEATADVLSAVDHRK